jgi:hypothetical protein
MDRKKRVNISTSDAHQTGSVCPQSVTRRGCVKSNREDRYVETSDPRVTASGETPNSATNTAPAVTDRVPPTCAPEEAARGIIEKYRGRVLTDAEWTKDRKRLVEFGLILKRWDAEQRSGGGTAVASKTCPVSDGGEAWTKAKKMGA